MPKVSKDTAETFLDVGVAEDRSSELDGYTVSFSTITKSHDLAPILATLPGGTCPCPHWGYLLKGRVVVRYADHEEVLVAGDAFTMPPGHVPEAEEGTEIVQFSPTDQMDALMAAFAKSTQIAPSA